MTQPWTPDILGEGFEQQTLKLDGGATATLVRYLRVAPEWLAVSGEIPDDAGIDADVL